MKLVQFEDIGKQDFREAWTYQEYLFEKVVCCKLENRDRVPDRRQPPAHYLLFCTHPPVYTLGRNGETAHLLLNAQMLKQKQIDFCKINRGGDITYHGPGQIVGYPIFDLDAFFTDIHKYLRYLEEAVIRTLKVYGIVASQLKGATGVWLDPEDPFRARKICAIGIRCSRWVTMHGFAFNVNTDLNYFKYIVPCGIRDKAVTSMQKELGQEVDEAKVKQTLLRELTALFEIELIRPESDTSFNAFSKQAHAKP